MSTQTMESMAQAKSIKMVHFVLHSNRNTDNHTQFCRAMKFYGIFCWICEKNAILWPMACCNTLLLLLTSSFNNSAKIVAAPEKSQ